MKLLKVVSIILPIQVAASIILAASLRTPTWAPQFMQRAWDITTLRIEPLAQVGRDRKSNYPRDLAFQDGIQRLIDDGIIHDSVLVISDTGHDIPMAAQLLKSSLPSQVAFYFPEKLGRSSKVIAKRLQRQAFDWQHDLKKQSNEPKVYFIGLEFHRENFGKPYYSIAPNQLPSEEELLAVGVKKIVYLYEVFFGGKEIDKFSKDLQEYINSFKKIKVEAHPTDCQRIPEC